MNVINKVGVSIYLLGFFFFFLGSKIYARLTNLVYIFFFIVSRKGFETNMISSTVRNTHNAIMLLQHYYGWVNYARSAMPRTTFIRVAKTFQQ